MNNEDRLWIAALIVLNLLMAAFGNSNLRLAGAYGVFVFLVLMLVSFLWKEKK
jgi:hypothetical protein